MRTENNEISKIKLEDYEIVHDPTKYMTIEAYASDGQRIATLSKYANGIQEFNEAVEKAKRLNAFSLRLTETGTAKTPLNKATAIYQISIFEKKIEPVLEPKQNFQGFGGLGSLGELNEYITSKVELETLRKDHQLLASRVADLTTKNDELNSQLDEADNTISELEQAVEHYKKYDPKGFTIGGIGVAQLFSAGMEMAANSFIKKNASGLAGFLGTDPETIRGLVAGQEQTQTQENQNIQNVSFDTDTQDEQTKARHEVAEQIYMWLKQLSTQDLFDVATLLDFVRTGKKTAKELLPKN
jgi:hypothetical protein